MIAGEQSVGKKPWQNAIELGGASETTSITLTDENAQGGIRINSNQGFSDLSLIDKDGKTVATLGR